MPSGAREEKLRLRFFAVIANVFVLLLILAAIIGFKEEKSIAALLGSINPWWILAAFILQIGTYFCTGGAWKVILQQFTPKVPLSEIALLAVEKLVFDQLFPTLGIGGSFMVMRSLELRGVEEHEALAMTFVDAICYYSAFFLLLALSAVILQYENGIGPLAHDIVLGFFGIVGGAVAVVAFLVWRTRVKGIVGWFNRFHFARSLASQIQEMPANTFSPRFIWIIAITLEMAVFGLDAVTLWVVFQALHSPLTFAQALAALVFSSAAAALSVLPGGLGFFEGAGILLLSSFGIPLGVAAAGIVLLRGFTYWLPMLPGYLILRSEFSAHAKLSQ